MNDNRRQTILVVDDVPENIDFLAAILGDDYRIIFATSGRDALTATQTRQPSLILLDVTMPGMDGYEVCRRLKADPRTRGIPVIFLTARVDADDEEYGLKLGAVDYLHRPCRPSIVLQRVRTHLQLHNQKLLLENMVRERTHELDDLYQNAPCGYHSLDENGVFIRINDTELKLLGYRREEVVGKMRLQDVLTPAGLARFRESYPRFMASGLAKDVEYEFIRKDGTVVPVRISATAITDDKGRFIKSRSVVNDVTAQKLAEHIRQRLSRALKLLSECNMVLVRADDEQVLLDSICRLTVATGGYLMAWIGIAEHDAAKTVRVASRYGAESGYLDARPISWDDTELGRGPTGTAIRTGTTQVNQDFLNNPALALWHEFARERGYQSSIALPLTNVGVVFGALTLYSSEPHAFGTDEVKLLEELAGNLTFGIESLRSRNAHFKALHDLHRTQQRLEGLFESIRDAIFVHGLRPDGRPECFVEVNDVACERLGYSRAELLAMSPMDIDAPECLADIGPTVERLLERKSVVFERVHVSKDGRRIPVEISSSTFTLDGRLMFVSLVRDITQRKETEQQLIATACQLHNLSAHLETVREEDRMSIARELHDELGQMLTALKMDISLLRGDLPAAGNATAKLEGMTALVDATLDSVRRIAADLRPTMLDDLGLKAAVEWLTEEFAKRYDGITCKLVFALDDCTVAGELATAAYRIIQECLTNVARHAQASKVHILVGIRDRRQLVVSVQDNGRGLPEQPAKKAGFGLLGMRERVNALGGAFALDSMPGEGVTVDVTIPLPDVDSGSTA